MKNKNQLKTIENHDINRVDRGPHDEGPYTCGCFIIPKSVLENFAKDKELTADQRKSFIDASKLEDEWRKIRYAKGKFSLLTQKFLSSGLTAAVAAIPPAVLVFDCKQGTALPGTPVPKPSSSTDATAKRTSVETTSVSEFFRKEFGRNSIDNAGMGLLSSIHYSVNYNNAFWNGSQMTYGDGDGHIFVDFTKSNDVIAHELTHGVTQFSAAFSYSNQAGGLNESMSDVFGSMFRQWRLKQTVDKADWMIGSDIMGPGALARGFKCLRDMSNPGANHCLAPQPSDFSYYKDGMDPHESSGIPNFAFYKAAMAIGGNSWEKAGRVWYNALTGFSASPYLKMKVFANRTRRLAGSLFPSDPSIQVAIDSAWMDVGL